jgi:hypothetical protein
MRVAGGASVCTRAGRGTGTALPAPRAAPCPARRCHRRAAPPRAAASGSEAALLELPASTAAQVRQARDAVQAAAAAGVTRQRLLLSLPLVGATDLGAP